MLTGQRQYTAKFLAAAALALALPAIAVVWLGTLLLWSDQELDRQRVQERLASAATLVVGSLEASFSQAERRLGAIAAGEGETRREAAAGFGLGPGEGAVVVKSPASTWSSMPLLYAHEEPVFFDEAASGFLDAEKQEFAGTDLLAAMAAYRGRSRSNNVAMRAGALARLGRVARKLGQPETALDAYAELATLGSTLALGRPADLVASLERSAVLSEAGETTRLVAEALALDQRLVGGHWRLSRSQFAFYRSQVTHWLGGSSGSRERDAAAASGTLVAEGAQAAWMMAVDGRTAAGRGTFEHERGDGLILWQRTGDLVTALVVTRGFADRTWLADVREVARAQRARVSLVPAASASTVQWRDPAPPDGSGPPGGGATIEWLDAGLSGAIVSRSAADTGLPFTVRVASADPEGDVSTFAGRRRLLASLVAALALLVIGSGYVAARGAAREMAAARLQSDFVAAVSHEFRTPVASVRQLAELLEEGRIHGEEKRLEYYGRIRRQAVRLQHLVENLLDFGRMESSATEYRMAPLDPASLVREVAAEFEAAVRGTPRHVDVLAPDALPAVVADREALGRALWNLLDNAAKYSAPDTPIAVEAAAHAGALVIRVRDQGPGIPADEQASIFDKFVRGAHAKESGAKGTGLGLAMVRHIVRAHRGDIRVESAPGAGATFTIHIPMAETTS
jgi:signal transduction histidine kinase